MDNVLLLSNSFEKHLKDLSEVFQRLVVFKLRVNREKSHFFKLNVEYQGQVITSEGIHVTPEKVSAVTNRLPPTNKKELQSVVQMFSWYRRFIPNFSKITRPLTHLQKKKAV